MWLDKVTAVEGNILGSSRKAALHHVKDEELLEPVRPYNCITPSLVSEFALAARLAVT